MDRLVNNLSNLMFQKDGRIRSFSLENPGAEKGAAAMAASELGAARKGAPFIRGFLPGTTEVLADIAGPGVIRHFFITVTDLPNGGSLKKLTLRMYWDGETDPSVKCPIGDFFCCDSGEVRELCTIPIAVIPARSFHCYFPMPFRERAVVTIENGYEEEISVVAYQITCTVDNELPKEIRYFCAAGRAEAEQRLQDRNSLIYPEKFCLTEKKDRNFSRKKYSGAVYWYQEKAEKSS